MLINRLPQESWTQTELRDETPDAELVAPMREQKFGPWALVNYQLADLRDSLRRLEYVTAVAGQLEPKPKPPEPTPRPGVRLRLISPSVATRLNEMRAKGA